MRVHPLALAALLITPALTALADDSALRRCRQISEPAARLVCYDALPLGGTPSAPASTAPGRAVAPGAVPPAPAATAPAQAVAPRAPAATPAASRANLESGFGMEGRVAQAELPAIESHIPGTFTGWGPNTRIRLANGQVWQVTGDEGSRTMHLQDAKVRVRRGMMGSFYMEFAAHNHSPRVRRVE